MKIEDFKGFKHPLQLATKRTENITVDLTMIACIDINPYYEVKGGIKVEKFEFISDAIEKYNSYDS
jgi:hypothetical protein